MSFLLEYNLQGSLSLQNNDSRLLNSKGRLALWNDLKGKAILESATADGSIIYYGDLISAPFAGTRNEFVNWLHSAKGNFNCIYYSEQMIMVFNSMFSMLPLFYATVKDTVYVSDQVKNLLPFMEQNVLDEFHFLERILFNYTLTDRTCISGVRQIPVNTCLKLTGSDVELNKHTEISDLFCDNPEPFKKSLPQLIDSFNTQLTDYLPVNLFNAALTAGFDGRSIVSLCRKTKKDFIAYSFGTKESDDVKIPELISKKTSIDYRPILITDKYLSEFYPDSAKKIVIESNGLSTIGRAHYHYGSVILSRRAGIMISGNCGSELLRASHINGVLTTAVFFYWLQYGLPDTWSGFLKLFPSYGFLNHVQFKSIYPQLASELEAVRQRKAELPLNAKLYYLMWEESLRNYFGAELCMQQQHLTHRSPFTDYTFFKAVQATMVSGAYYNYRDKNPVRRMKGQLFYAHFIRQNDHDLFKFPTGRGYSPADILSVEGKVKLIYSKFVKRNKNSDYNTDPLFSTKGYKAYYDEFVSKLIPELKELVDLDQAIDENSMKTLISFSLFLDHVNSERVMNKRG